MNERILDVMNKLEPIQKTGTAIILVVFGLTGKNKLRRNELATNLGAKLSKKEGGLISDKTLDTRLKELIEKNILKAEMDYESYPPGKYYKLTKKGEEVIKILLQLVNNL